MATPAAQEQEQEEPEGVPVDPDAPEDEDKEDDEDKPAEKARTRPSKSQRGIKAAREAEAAALARASAAETRAAEQDERLRRMELEQAELKGRMAATAQRPEEDENRKIAELRQKRWSALARADGAQSARDAEMALKDVDDIEEQIADIRVDRKLKAKQSSGPTREDYEATALKAEFPFVGVDEKATRWAAGARLQLLADGKPDTLSTAREAAAMAARKFGHAGSPTPTATQQQRYTSPGGSQAIPATAKTGKVILSQAQQKMAIARWPDLDEPVAFQRMGKLLRDQGIA